ncbi:MAG: hypothetical protein AAF639_01120 [Chloroflexota bacterium]
MQIDTKRFRAVVYPVLTLLLLMPLFQGASLFAAPSTANQPKSSHIVYQQNNSEPRLFGTELRGELVGQAVDGAQTYIHYLTLIPLVADQDVEVVLAYEPRDNRQLLGLINFHVLTEDGLRRYRAGESLVSTKLTSGTPDQYDAIGNKVRADLLAAGLEPYTIVVDNRSPFNATYTLSVKGAVLADSLGQTSAVQSFPVELVPQREPTPVPQVVLKTQTNDVTGVLNPSNPSDYWTIAPDFRNSQIELTFEFHPMNEEAFRNKINFLVLDEDGLRRHNAGQSPESVSFTNGLPIPYNPFDNQLSARFTAPSAQQNYTVIVYNDTALTANYTLSVSGGRFLVYEKLSAIADESVNVAADGSQETAPRATALAATATALALTPTNIVTDAIATSPPATLLPTALPPTALPPTSLPSTAIAPTSPPPTAIPPTAIPTPLPTALPTPLPVAAQDSANIVATPTAIPTANPTIPPTAIPAATPVATVNTARTGLILAQIAQPVGDETPAPNGRGPFPVPVTPTPLPVESDIEEAQANAPIIILLPTPTSRLRRAAATPTQTATATPEPTLPTPTPTVTPNPTEDGTPKALQAIQQGPSGSQSLYPTPTPRFGLTRRMRVEQGGYSFRAISNYEFTSVRTQITLNPLNPGDPASAFPTFILVGEAINQDEVTQDDTPQSLDETKADILLNLKGRGMIVRAQLPIAIDGVSGFSIQSVGRDAVGRAIVSRQIYLQNDGQRFSMSVEAPLARWEARDSALFETILSSIQLFEPIAEGN